MTALHTSPNTIPPSVPEGPDMNGIFWGVARVDSAEDIAAQLTETLQPPEQSDGVAPIVRVITDVVEQKDWRNYSLGDRAVGPPAVFLGRLSLVEVTADADHTERLEIEGAEYLPSTIDVDEAMIVITGSNNVLSPHFPMTTGDVAQ